VLLKPLEMEREGMLQNSFYEAGVTLKPKQEKKTMTKRKL
jgi:hypothetical protein